MVQIIKKKKLAVFAFLILLVLGGTAFLLLQLLYDADDVTHEKTDTRETAIASDARILDGNSTSENLDPDIYRVPGTLYPRGVNFIFFADGYLSWKEFDKDIQLLMEQLQRIEPWASYSRYNVYKILPKEIGICAIKVKDERKPVLRCSPEGINSYLNKLRMNHFKVIVLSKRDFQSWANVSRLADSGIFFSIPQSPVDTVGEETTGIFFLHMIGHAFGLKDEEIFVIAKAHSAAHQPDGPNCAPDLATAKKWWGDLIDQDHQVGYFKGCAANPDYIKPTEGSLMNLGDLSQFVPDYGPVSEEYLRKMLTYCFSEKTYSINDDPEFFARYPELKECVE